eukprot:TRINITY_DN16516_c0_g1_i2.p1 TRINITY_DN16516_c0_g1~~TRINITY_DN16516_c0_g1_i2.p1  ORF type:complete len:215 (-),score=66.94 TRINITY_DN16516_c0_g1_i2:274-918(-)
MQSMPAMLFSLLILATATVTDTVEVAQQASLQKKHLHHKHHGHQHKHSHASNHHTSLLAVSENQSVQKDSKLAKKEMEKSSKVEDAKPAEKEEKSSKAEADADVSDPQLPFGDMEPFGRETTAQQLTEESIKESNAMVDQIEKAELAEEQRSVFRALTRLRGAALASFDGIARSATGSIEQHAQKSQWRKEHGIKHLAEEEDDVEKWAFPSNAD